MIRQTSFPLVEFPLRGEWRAVRSPGHHRHAYDFAAVRGDRFRLFSVSKAALLFGSASSSDSYGWGAPVYSPIDGEVVTASDGWTNTLNIHLLKDVFRVFANGILHAHNARANLSLFAGNHIIITSSAGLVFLAHLQCGSLKVASQDSVSCGQLLASVGSSGNSAMPHLHFQINDGPDLFRSKIKKFGFSHYQRRVGNHWERVKGESPQKGWLIRSDAA
jgi:hypothetical protein